ncbi:SOS response-associated peptidase [Halomonas sp. 18H]|uniref:SOS response-associated peptidase n=1 Tax=Halomonas almeriensis TaxID=308163 RepID=UPI00222F3B5A|nr:MULTISPECIES: SOS response-associated peptidase [Halomonas]MCW4152527.1 SOS response-associated peptidase [Halomonas sp. 18H]MDN3553897.1 SOS response-associated peptidase [Halomonas almeriensis]
MAGRLYIPTLSWGHLLPRMVVEETPVTSPNLAPRQPVPLIRLEAGRPRLGRAFWGLTPPWLKVLDHAPHCARAESLESRAMFREAFSARRCLVPVGGVYVWRPMPRAKQPYLVTRADRGPLLLAALWCRFHTTLTAYNDSLALITVPSNNLLSPLTDRLPAVIGGNAATTWLDAQTPLESVRRQLATAPTELLGAFPVSKGVNDPDNQEASCAYPIGPMLRGTSPQET